jgi:4-hydroxybenzoate polyprenyltransferase
MDAGIVEPVRFSRADLSGTNLAAAQRRPGALRSLLLVMRPHQWVKNLTCFAGLLFSGRLVQAEMLISAGLAFGAFCLMASAIYLFNDYIDRHRDRLNPKKAGRPLASGALSVWVAGVAFVGLFAGAGAIAVTLGWTCVVVLAAYAALNIGYTLRLKHAVIADVMCIASGFVLRVLFGVYAVQAAPSPWIILCMFFLALFLGFGKRKAEMSDTGSGARPVLRMYSQGYIDMVFGITATITILTYMLFALGGQHDPTMVITVVPVVYCVLRYAHQVAVEGTGESPEALFLKDKMMWIGVGSWVVLCVLILYADLRLVELPHR